MMQTDDLASASTHFAQAVTACDPRVRFGPITAETLEAIQRHLPLSSDLMLWYRQMAPQVDADIPQVGNDCAIYAPTRLVERQNGYRWIASPSGQLTPSEHWPDEWIVIGDVGGDPVIADTNETGTPILQSWHGGGCWDTILLAPTLAAYLEASAIWIEVCLLQTGAVSLGDFGVRVTATLIWDEDDELLETVRFKLSGALARVLPQSCLSMWLR